MKKHRLDNGVTVLLDEMPDRKSVSVALYFLAGLRDEAEELIGITHFLEHMLFRKTKGKNSFQIACAIDELGGDVNAFTDAESLCLYGETLNQRAVQLFDFLVELAFHHQFEQSDLLVEREIIKREIAESFDQPDTEVYHELSANIWADTNLQFPVFGTTEHVESWTVSALRERFQKIATGSRLVVAVSGGFTEKRMLEHITGQLHFISPGLRVVPDTPTYGSGIHLLDRPNQQTHFALGWPWPATTADEFLTASIVSSVLSQGLSSRLFQELREKTGLVYDIACEIESYLDCGMYHVSAIVDAKDAERALGILYRELASLRDKGVSQEELNRTMLAYETQLILDDESVDSRMWQAIDYEVTHGRHFTLSDQLARLRNIHLDRVNEVASKWIPKGGAVLALGGELDVAKVPAEISEFCSAE